MTAGMTDTQGEDRGADTVIRWRRASWEFYPVNAPLGGKTVSRGWGKKRCVVSVCIMSEHV